MTNLRPNFYDVRNWVVLDTKTVNMYDDNETPFVAVKLKVGVLDIEEININNTYSKCSVDIIRWISKKEFDRLIINSGIVVW